MNFLPVIILYMEVLLLAFAERKLWNTWFTPLNCLSAPYALVLAVCLCIDGKMGFVPFYYPSIWVWVVGLAVFFVPSCILGLLKRRRTGNDDEPVTAKDFTVSSVTRRILEYVTWGIFALFIFWFFYLTYTTDLILGSELFSVKWAGHGFFGHLFALLMGLNIFWLFAADKDHKRYWLYVVGFFGVALLYLVKGWFLIPMAGGLLLRLLTKKTKFGFGVIFASVFTGLAFFFATYWMSMYVSVVVKERRIETQIQKQVEISKAEVSQAEVSREEPKTEVSQAEVSSYIGKHAVTYISAGVYGLSEDLAQNTLEEREPAKIYAPFVNIYKFLGDKKYITNINDKFLQITTHDAGSNVRSFFGSLYVYLGLWHSLAYVFVFSGLVYLLLAFALKRRYMLPLIVEGWVMGCLLMGWFDPYTATLKFLLIPSYLLMVFLLGSLITTRKPTL